MRRAALLAVVALVLPAAASARPPYRASIVDGVSAGGLRLGTTLTRVQNDDGTRFTTPPLDVWGRVYTGFCFEGNSCAWSVPGGGYVVVLLSQRERVLEVAVSASEWRTRRGVHAGVSARTARRRYPGRLQAIHTCRLGGFGAPIDGLVLRHARTTTLFELRRGRVRAVWIVGRRLPQSSGCS